MDLTTYNKTEQRTERAALFSANEVTQILDLLESKKRQQERLLVRLKNKILPVCPDAIALFHLEHNLVKLVTFEAKTYFIQKSLDELEQKCDLSFYRVNRQFLVNKRAIVDVTTAGRRTITVNLSFAYPHPITVSKNKYGEFLDWLV